MIYKRRVSLRLSRQGTGIEDSASISASRFLFMRPVSFRLSWRAGIVLFVARPVRDAPGPGETGVLNYDNSGPHATNSHVAQIKKYFLIKPVIKGGLINQPVQVIFNRSIKCKKILFPHSRLSIFLMQVP